MGFTALGSLSDGRNGDNPFCGRRVLTPNIMARRRSRRRVRLRRGLGTSQVVQILCRRQVACLVLHPSTIRTCPSSSRNLSSPRAPARRPPEHRTNYSQLTHLWVVVELGRRSTTGMDGAQHGHAGRLLLYSGECWTTFHIRARSNRSSTFTYPEASNSLPPGGSARMRSRS